jgi:hypothetical protein
MGLKVKLLKTNKILKSQSIDNKRDTKLKKFMATTLATLLFLATFAGAICTPKAVPTTRWMQFTYQINGIEFIDYLKFKSLDSCGYITAVNEYGSLLKGFRKGGPDVYRLSLETNRSCWYLDTYVFLLQPCLNPRKNMFWHHGSFKCWATTNLNILCPSCEPLCSSVRLVYFQVMPSNFNPNPPETENNKQYRKWLAER